MTITIEEAKAFIASCEKTGSSYKNWLIVAERSWDEIKKRRKSHRLWSTTPNSLRKRARYPAWYSIFKIRQPLILSRVGIPIGKDTTQDGNDTIGAAAAICLERLAVNLAKSFDFFDVMSYARDDFLATNLGWVRAYYERDEITEQVKEYITPQKSKDGKDVVFVNQEGKIVESDDIEQDDEGYFIELNQTVDVENESICLEPLLYKDIYVDPDIRRWKRCKRLAFANYYSEREFKDIFGTAAFLAIPAQHDEKIGQDDATVKKQSIKVFEYWDWYEKECYYFAEHGTDFITPKDYLIPDSEEANEEKEYTNGIYNLENFFPVPPPLITNAPTDEFWPVCEYFQLTEIFEDIHTIFSRMVGLTKAVRARLLFDNNIEGLQAALNEAAEGDAFGVPNLAQILASSGGSLENVVQYIPVEKLINGLNQMYTALEQRLNTIYKLTGTSDLLQGFVTDQTDRTFGERQLQEKYALNQVAESQRKMMEFVRDCYQLICEMALKNFKDSSLDKYIMPQTLPDDIKPQYRAALGMLKENQKRFRIELETDSTIALNEDYDKKMRIEIVNTLTSAIEKTANIAESSPALVSIELHALKHLIQGMRQGKMFQGEITQAIDNVIQQSKNAPPPFNKDEADAQFRDKKFQSDAAMEQYKISSGERVEMAKLQQTQEIAGFQSQLDAFKVESQRSQATGELQLKLQALQTSVSEAQEQMALKRDELLVELRKVTDKKEVEQFQQVIDQSVAQWEIQLQKQDQELKAQKVMLDEKERIAQEARLQSEHQLEQIRTGLDVLRHRHETMQTQLTQQSPQAPVINVHVPKPPSLERTTEIMRDPEGNIIKLKHSDVQGVQGGQ